MTITELLRRQHDSFRRTLREMRDALKDPEGMVHERLDRALRRFLPLLAAHEEIEHDLLFPALSEGKNAVSPEIIESFDKEHEEIHRRIGELLEALQIPDGALRQLVATSDFTSVLAEHLEQEEATLFPLVESALPRESLKSLGVVGNERTAEVFEAAYREQPS